MIRQILRRIVTMAVTLLVISALVFIIIKLPPGDYLSNRIMSCAPPAMPAPWRRRSC